MKPLTLEETALKEEMKERCLAKGQYIDEKAKDKFKMLCHLEDFEVQYWELQEENKQLKDLIDTILNFSFFKEECPLNFSFEDNSKEDKAQDVFYEDEYCENACIDDYRKCWLKYFEKMQELERGVKMNLEDYNKYYIQGSDHYLIPKDVFKELFNEMVNWKEESQKKKEVFDKAIEYILKETKSMPVNGCSIRLKELLDILKEVE